MPSASKEMPAFTFLHAGSHKPLAWPKYKLKECWTLVLCLLQLRGTSGPVIVHNWWAGRPLAFTREFRDMRAMTVDPQLAAAPVIEAQGTGIGLKILALLVATLLFALPLHMIGALARWAMPLGMSSMVVYADGHLSGFILVLAARSHGKHTITLQHGLYRSDDRGSAMMMRNFVADQICLWDDATLKSYLDLGVVPERLLKVGVYGFTQMRADGPVDPDRFLLCPSYDTTQIRPFHQLQTFLPEGAEALWSLHPMLRSKYSDLEQAALATVIPRPALAVCGDSGVIMDALARRIPVVTISDRPLTKASMTLTDFEEMDAANLLRLSVQAAAALEIDRQVFGFDQEPDGENSV